MLEQTEKLHEIERIALVLARISDKFLKNKSDNFIKCSIGWADYYITAFHLVDNDIGTAKRFEIGTTVDPIGEGLANHNFCIKPRIYPKETTSRG